MVALLSLCLWTGPGENKVRVGYLTVSDEHLPSRYLPLATLELRCRLYPRNIRPRTRLSHSVGADLIPRNQWKKELFLLLLGPPFTYRLRDEVARDEDSRTGSRDASEFFDRYDHREHVPAESTVFFLVGDGWNA